MFLISRWPLVAILAVLLPLLATDMPAQAQLGAFFLAKSGAGVVSPGTPTAVSVLSNGWQADVTLKTTTCGGSLASYALTPDATPKMTLTVTSPGYDTSGNSTTISRTVVGTIPLRQPYNNVTLPTETQSGADCVVRVALSDFVNLHDTATASFVSGAYTGSLAGTPAVTNNSTLAHAPPVCNWVTPDYQQISSGADFVVEALCFHARPKSGTQVAAVKFSIADGSSHTYTCISNTMPQSAFFTTGNPAYIYSCTFAAGSMTNLVAGNVTLDMTAYPWVGDNPVTASAGQDGTPITSSAHDSSLKALTEVYDTTSKYAPAYAWVCYATNSRCTAGAVGTCATNACVSSSSTDPGAAAAANYPDVYTAMLNCESFNNANRSHNDTADCIIYVGASTGFHGWGATNLRTLTVGATWAKIMAAPGQSNTTVIDTPTTSAPACDTNAACADLADRTWVENIGFTQGDTVANQHNTMISGPDGGASLTEEQVCKLCTFNLTSAAYPVVYQAYHIHFFDIKITGAANGSCTPFCNYGSGPYADTFMGGQVTFGTTNRRGVPFVAAGLQSVGLGYGWNTAANCTALHGYILAFNSVMSFHTAPFKNNTNGTSACYPAGHVSSVQNIFENIDQAADSVNFLGDTDENPITNAFTQYDTIIGGRYNECYNDGTGPTGVAKSTAKLCQDLWLIVDPLTTGAEGYNRKADTFVGTPNGARIGNFPTRFGVGSVGVLMKIDAFGATAPSASSFLGDGIGRTGSTTANNFGYNQSVTWTSGQGATGGANGSGSSLTGASNYKPSGTCSSSAAYGRVYSGYAGLPFDILGVARRNDGTGAAGAVECGLPIFLVAFRRRKTANDNGKKAEAA